MLTERRSYGSQQRPSPIVKRRVSNAFLAEVNAFCTEETAVIGTCVERLDTEVFQYDFSVGWFRGDRFLGQIAALNAPVVKNALQRFFVAARDSLKRFQFVGLYMVRDIDAWIARIEANIQAQEEADRGATVSKSSYEEEEEEDEECDDVAAADKHASERRALMRFNETIAANLPFGVIPTNSTNDRDCYGHYVRMEDRSTMTQTLVFEPNASWQEAALYEFRVIDKGAKFRAGTGANQDLIPLSPFVKLAEDYSLFEEARTATFDYNAMQIYRDEYAIANPQQDERIENVEERILYGMDSLLRARQQPAYERENLALENARATLNRVQMKRALARPLQQQQQQGEQSVSIGMQRVAQCQRPSRSDFLVEIPRSVQIPTTAPHNPTYNPEQLRREYEHNVCAVMGLPFPFFKPFASHHHGSRTDSASSSSRKDGGGDSSTTSGESRDFVQAELDKEVQRQHALFSELFAEVYCRTFQVMDDATFHSLDFYKQMRATVSFDYVVRKSDHALRNLLPYYHARILSPVIIRRFLYQNLGIDDDPEIEPEFPQQQQQQDGATNKKENATEENTSKKKRKKDDDTGEGEEESSKKKKKKTSKSQRDEGGDKENE